MKLDCETILVSTISMANEFERIHLELIKLSQAIQRRLDGGDQLAPPAANMGTADMDSDATDPFALLSSAILLPERRSWSFN